MLAHHDELVAAESGEHVTATHCLSEPARDLDQELSPTE